MAIAFQRFLNSLRHQLLFLSDLQLFLFVSKKLYQEDNFACSIICFWLDGNISSPIRYSYLSILHDDKIDILAASLLTSNCSYSSLIWFSIVMIFLYIYFKRFSFNLKGLFDGKVVSLTKNDYGSAV